MRGGGYEVVTVPHTLIDVDSLSYTYNAPLQAYDSPLEVDIPTDWSIDATHNVNFNGVNYNNLEVKILESEGGYIGATISMVDGSLTIDWDEYPFCIIFVAGIFAKEIPENTALTLSYNTSEVTVEDNFKMAVQYSLPTPDMEENDPTSRTFIKNKPFEMGNGTYSVQVIPAQTMSDGASYMPNTGSLFVEYLYPGYKYDIYFDDLLYAGIEREDIQDTSFEKYPFAFEVDFENHDYMYNNNGFITSHFQDGSSHTVSIYIKTKYVDTPIPSGITMSRPLVILNESYPKFENLRCPGEGLYTFLWDGGIAVVRFGNGTSYGVIVGYGMSSGNGFIDVYNPNSQTITKYSFSTDIPTPRHYYEENSAM